PIVYCLEQVDMPAGVEVDDVRIARGTPALVEPSSSPGRRAPDLVLRVTARTEVESLYGDADAAAGAPAPDSVDVTAVPFATWGNRGPGAMRIWLPLED